MLPLIEESANTLFEGWNERLGLQSGGGSHLVPLETLQTAQGEGRLWVALDREDDPVGFALASAIDASVHLDEIDVLPQHGRRGLGSALVEAVCDWAREQGSNAITLTTFRDVPWNAPFYERLGFRILQEEEFSPGLARLIEEERRGKFRTDLRVAMRREI